MVGHAYRFDGGRANVTMNMRRVEAEKDERGGYCRAINVAGTHRTTTGTSQYRKADYR